MSTSLYDTFGNETSYRVVEGTLYAYLKEATIKFPLPEAGSEILATLNTNKIVIKDPVKLDIVRLKLERIGYKPANAKAFAPVLVQVAQAQGIDPLDYFSLNSNSLNLTIDAYNAINTMRPVGSRIGVYTPVTNNKSPARGLIKP